MCLKLRLTLLEATVGASPSGGCVCVCGGGGGLFTRLCSCLMMRPSNPQLNNQVMMIREDWLKMLLDNRRPESAEGQRDVW